MTGTEWLVVLGAITAIAWVNWYFFVAGRTPAAAAVALPAVAEGGAGVAGAIAEVVIEVDGGYSPNAVRVKAGEPVRLVFDRKDDSSCSEEVVIPDFGIRRYLPTGQRTTIELTPEAAGKYGFTCGMSMLRGTIIAED
jgi:plastocyanin domain-containing protein